MKKAVLATVVLMMTSLVAKADVVCAVTAEAVPNEYSQLVISKSLKSQEGYTVILEENGLTYGVEISAGKTVLTVADRVNSNLIAAAMSLNDGKNTTSMILPFLKRSFSCTNIN